jgi:hypothetical protein
MGAAQQFNNSGDTILNSSELGMVSPERTCPRNAPWRVPLQ